MLVTLLFFIGIVVAAVGSAELVRGTCRRMLRQPPVQARSAAVSGMAAGMIVD